MGLAEGGSCSGHELNKLRFAVQVLRGRWFMVFASLLIMSAAGATYIFSIYSKDIKSALGYDQQTLNTLSFFKDLGANVGVLSGLINEVTPPWVVLAIGAGMNLFGYLMIYLAITGRIARPKVWQMCLYICVGANSQSFANTGALVTAVKNFPESRGIVLGLLKGYVGLSGAIFTEFYHAFYGNDSKSLVLLIAWLPAAISIVFVYTIRIMKVTRQASNTKPFYNFLYISLALAAYLMIVIILGKLFNFSHGEFGVDAAVVLFFLLLPLFVVIKQELSIFHQKKQELENPQPLAITIEKPSVPQPPIASTTATSSSTTTAAAATTATAASSSKPSSATSAVVSCFKSMFRPPDRGQDYSILQALVSIDMLILFFATICGVGGTLTAIDNMGQIGESLGYPKKSISTFVSLISIWNYAGRVVAGFSSEIFLQRYKFPRPLMFTFVLFLSCVGHLLIAFGVPNSLYFASVVIGFCFGAQWPLLFAIISEIFGLKYYSTLYNFGAVASPIGSYILNVRVAGHLYDKEAAKKKILLSTSTGNKDYTCIGTECYRLSFFIVTAATVAGGLVSLILVWRTRDFYKSDIYAKFREAAAAAENEMAMESFGKQANKGEEEEANEKNKSSGKDGVVNGHGG